MIRGKFLILPFIACPLTYILIDAFVIGNVSSKSMGYNALGIDLGMLVAGVFLYVLYSKKSNIE